MYFSFVEKERINIAGKKVEIFCSGFENKKNEIICSAFENKKVEIMLFEYRGHVSKTVVNSVAGKKSRKAGSTLSLQLC